jgi:DNA-binding MarR family transcriptional regulator
LQFAFTSVSVTGVEDVEIAALAADLRVVVARLRRRLRAESGPGDYSPSQVAVLLRLERDGPATVTDLARAEGVRPQSLGANVAVLEAAGMVSGAPDPSDGRRTILSLTDHAREAIASIRAAKQSWLVRAVRATLTDAEQQQLVDSVALLQRLADS